MIPPRMLRAGLLLAGLFTASAASAGYSGLYVFGDSDSDAGNLAAMGVPLQTGADIVSPASVAGAYSPSLTASNGAVWSQQLSARLGLGPLTASLAGGTDYATSGAFLSPTALSPLPSVSQQVDSFVAQPGAAPGSALYVIEGGTNDFRMAAKDALQVIMGGGDPTGVITAFIAQYVGETASMIGKLKADGAQHILVWNLPDVTRSPVYIATTPSASLLSAMQAALMAANATLQAQLGGIPGVTILDAFGILTDLVDNPGQHGLTNVTDPCYDGTCDTSTNLFWDGMHLTSAGYQAFADAAYDAVAIPEPGTLALSLAGLALTGRRLRRRG